MIYLDGRDQASQSSVTAPDSVAGLIQARLANRLSRRGLIERAAGLGIAAPVIGVMLHATSDAAVGGARWQAEATPPAQAPGTISPGLPSAPAGEPRQGGTLTIGAMIEPDTLHPWLVSTVAGFDLLDGIMDGLFRYNSEQRLQAALAEGFDISDDGLVYAFALRPDVVFHNGDSFTAADVVAAWETKLDPAFGAYSILGWDKIATIDIRDELTVIIQTTEPYAPFLSTVATTFLCPSRAIAEGLDAFRERFAGAPVGTGPFRLVAWEPGERIVLERFTNYWGPAPVLDDIVYQIVPGPEEQLDGLRSGVYQLAGGAAAISPTRIDEALAIAGVAVYEHPTQNWQHIDLKQVGFLRESLVRRGLDYATPRQRIIDELLAGHAIPAVADQAPGTWAHDPRLEPRPYDLEQAAALLAEAGLRPGNDGVLRRDGQRFVIELWGVSGDQLAERIIAMIAASWNAVGVFAIPRFETAATLWGPLGYQFSDRMTACLYTWTNANDPDDIFYWHSSQIPTSPTASGGNLPAFFHPYEFQAEIDELTTEAALALDIEVRRELYWDIQEVLSFEAPVIFLYWEQAFPATAANLGGFWPSAYTHLLWNAADWYFTDPPPAAADG